jgi:K+-sensing histidine kinase KdpD
MRPRSEYLVLLRPWSLSAFAAAFIAVMFAATLQEVIASFGTTPYFASFVPAILLASLLGGAPAGTFAAALSIPIIWWAFMPPHFEFNPLTAAEYDSFAVFVLVSSLAICFAHLFREARCLIRKRIDRQARPGSVPSRKRTSG